MRWNQRGAIVAIALAVTTQAARAQVVLDYSTVGSFTGTATTGAGMGTSCLGLNCIIGGMTVTFVPLTHKTVTLDANNSYFSFLSYGSFVVTGAALGQVAFNGINFSLTMTQNLPTPGGAQILTGPLQGGVDVNSSNLSWLPLPIVWTEPNAAGNPVSYNITSPFNLQAPTSTTTGTSIQGQASTIVASTVPEPSTLLLIGAGMAGLLVVNRKRNRA